MDSNLLDCSIPWWEAIENFTPPERSSKLPTTSMSSMSSMSSSGLSVELRAWRRESAACESKAQDCV